MKYKPSTIAKSKRTLLLIICFALLSPLAKSQLSVTNLLETQVGNLPGAEPDDMLTLYNQLNLRYRLNGFNAFIRTEQYHANIDNPNEYFQISRFGLTYQNQYLDIKAGHFYETLGRGLLLRGYEIPGSIYEDRATRARQAFYKDMQGGSITGRLGDLSLKVLAGRSLQNQLPPTHKDRRNDSIAAAEISYRLANQQFGAIWLYLQNPYQNDHFASFNVGGSLGESLSYYGEIAKKVNDEQSLLDFNTMSSYGAYLSLNYSLGRSGFSIEYKDYHNFVIGSGIADPPTLVKEHSYHLLNRSTHITELLDERGIQFEAFTGILENHLITFNYSRALNDFGLAFDFQEFFLELSTTGLTDLEYKIFADYSSEDLLLEKHRIAGGTNLKYHLNNGWTTAFDFEYQHIKRGLDNDLENIDNVYAALVLSRSSKFSAALQFEYTNDPFVEEAETNGSKLFPGINLSYRPISGQTLQLFAGERRGGTACTAGICYEVLEFKGVELRWIAKF